jgi:NaMN:DMB phosphoribosyltransferase
MSVSHAHAALEAGVEVARAAIASGATLIGIGEMGIANSTSAAALLAAFMRIRPARLAGRSGGLAIPRIRCCHDVGLRHELPFTLQPQDGLRFLR